MTPCQRQSTSNSAVARQGKGSGGPRTPRVLPSDPAKQLERGMSHCLQRLSAMARTTHELREGLQRRGYPADTIGAILARLHEYHYVDDREFAMQWVQSRHRTRGSSRAVLAAELQRKGIDRELADEALAQITSASEQDRAAQFAAAKVQSAPSRLRDDPEALRRRLIGMLARRGYSYETSAQAVAQALS